MRDALALRLEQISYFEHRALSGGRDPVICACRLIEIRGARYHVLSRLQDAGLDFTNRTNFIAHHLVFSPEEIPPLPLPPDIFQAWTGWVTSWTEEPRSLSDETWANLASIGPRAHTPTQTWARVTGDAANALGLLDCGAGVAIQADGNDENTVLALLAESMALLEVREPDSDFRSAAWRFTFTTSLQERDQPTDFRWRFIHADSPAYARLSASGQSALPLAGVQPKSPTNEALTFARNGSQPPLIAREPEDLKIQEGQPLKLRVEVAGVPVPRRFQWFERALDGSEKPIAGQTSVELCLPKANLGNTRYLFRATNARGETAASRVALVAVEQAPRVASPSRPRSFDSFRKPASPATGAEKPVAWVADAEETARFLEGVRRKKRRKKILVTGAVVIGLAAAGGFFFSPPGKKVVSALRKKPANTNAEPTAAADNAQSGAANPAEIGSTNSQGQSNSVPATNPSPERVFAETKKPEAKATNTVPTNPPAKPK